MAASASKPPAGDDRNLVTIDENYLAPSFEDRLQIFWEKHARTISAIVVIVVVALVVRWLFGLFADQRERAIQADYAAASSPAQLQAFITSNPRAPLAGVASLRLADEAYVAGNFADAREHYETAARLLGNDPLGNRARLGAAITPLQAGDTGAGKSALNALVNDTTFVAPLRAESAYHLAVIARDAGDVAEATRLTGVAISVDPEGMWAQRALQLRSGLPVATSPAASESSPTEGTALTNPSAE